MKKNIFNYNHKESEPKWQKAWNDAQIFKFDENSAKPKFYELEMLPYPSGKIHMGHLRNYAIGDVIARFKMMQGFNVLHPMGFDAFGLPAENAALQHKIHPEKWTLENIKTMRDELKTIGLSIDWSREIATCLPEYYKHEQKIFLDFLNAGLVYQKESLVNWDPIDNTVLSNEQVIDGRGWRSGALVEKKKLRQWFLKISDFSQELLQELNVLKGWDERVLTMQEKWIGKSEGALIDFEVVATQIAGNANYKNISAQISPNLRAHIDENNIYYHHKEPIAIYTTRPETLFGASFLAISADHQIAKNLAKTNAEIANFISECNQGAVDEQTLEKQEKKGIKTGLQAIHPLDKNIKLDIYIANFVLMDYGTGALFGCPAHDERDFEFAKKYNLSIKQVVAPLASEGHVTPTELPFLDNGLMINSQFLDGLQTTEAKEKIIKYIEENKLGKRQINYRLRDWGVSRQRYWGCPIPILYLEDGSVVPVPEEELPVELPKDVEFTGNGNPLANHPTWKYTTYKGQKAIRETDTLDTFFESSWYFLRYISQPTNKAFDRDVVNKFMPVDQYVGGIEHAVLHLLYARFFTKALKKCGYLDFDEPFKSLLTQGMVCHHTFKNQKGEWVFPSEAIEIEVGKFIHEKTREPLLRGRSEKMSKSKKNVVEPLHIVEAYGADTARLFMLSDSPASRDLEWSESGIDGAWKYINRLWKLIVSNKDVPEISQEIIIAQAKNSLGVVWNKSAKIEDQAIKSPKGLEIIKLTQKTIRDVKKEFDEMGFNRAIAKIREFSNVLEKFETTSAEEKSIMNFALKTLVLLFAPIMPHLAEECWQELKNEGFVSIAKFPEFIEELVVEDFVKVAVQVSSKLRAVIEMPKGLDQDQVEEMARKNENVIKFLEEKSAKKLIFVKDKLINFVI